MFKTCLILVMFALGMLTFSVACSGSSGPNGPQQEPTPSPELPTEIPTSVTETPALSPGTTDTPSDDYEDPGETTNAPPLPTTPPRGSEEAPTVETPPGPGVVPQGIFNPIMEDVVKRTGAGPTEIQRRRAEAVVWNDGSLGCPKPGEVYTQALVDGYWVVLEYQGKEFDYRVNSQGSFFLCEKTPLPGVVPPGGGGPDRPSQ
jgi:hypothetical protein